MREIMGDGRWYSAGNAVLHFREDIVPGDTSKLARKAEELCITGAMLVGMQEVEQKQYWLKAVPDEEYSPDVRSITLIEREGGRAPDGQFQDVEVVTYTHSSKESLIEFLLRTKLSENKAYDEQTVILLYVKEAVMCPPPREWIVGLNGCKHRCPVLLLGHAHATEPIFTLKQVYPVYKEIITFNLPKTIAKQGYTTGTINLTWNPNKKEVRRENDVHCPFESLGIVCKS
jgi:hypothetical protein